MRGRRHIGLPGFLLLCEATILLACARAAIAVLPFRKVGALAAWQGKIETYATAERRDIARRVRWAVTAAARRVPFRAACFQQGLAAQVMLHRRGIPSCLYYGAARDRSTGLIAHVWVRDQLADGEEADVVGCEEASRFAVLARFPQPE